ncbi:hypothetical protein LCGC14_3076120, partial [marine sediment metagenome]
MRIFVVSGYGYWGHFLPTDLGGEDVQVGGGETAMVQLSKQLAKLGHQVIVFHDIERPGKYDGVDYLPTQMFMYLATQMEHDVLVTWDYPPVFRFADRGKVHVVAYQLNDTVVGIYDHVIDRYFHPSEWHLERFQKLYPEIAKSKCRPRMTNGIDPTRYLGDVERNPKRVIYSSSPDRGLHHLLRIWPT